MLDEAGNLKPFTPRLFTQLITRQKQTIMQLIQLTMFAHIIAKKRVDYIAPSISLKKHRQLQNS